MPKIKSRIYICPDKRGAAILISACLLAVHRGVGAMEIVAMDMKVSGMYIARQLSFSGVSFRIEEIALDEEFKVVYNKAARLVRVCRQSERDCATERSRSFTVTSLLRARVTPCPVSNTPTI